MDTEPLLITLARALDRDHVDFRVFAEPATPDRTAPDGSSPRGRKPHTELATIELNRRICFPDGRVHAIAHRGGLLSSDRELRQSLPALPGAPAPALPAPRGRPTPALAPRSSAPDAAQHAIPAPLAICHRERTGLLRLRRILIVAGDPASGPERRFLLRRRHWFGSPANVDVVALDAVPLDGARRVGPADTAGPVLLRAEKSGSWRQRLQASWLSPKDLSLPVVLFVLNVLADLDRRAAVAASAGAAGL